MSTHSRLLIRVQCTDGEGYLPRQSALSWLPLLQALQADFPNKPIDDVELPIPLKIAECIAEMLPLLLVGIHDAVTEEDMRMCYDNKDTILVSLDILLVDEDHLECWHDLFDSMQLQLHIDIIECLKCKSNVLARDTDNGICHPCTYKEEDAKNRALWEAKANERLQKRIAERNAKLAAGYMQCTSCTSLLRPRQYYRHGMRQCLKCSNSNGTG